MVDATAPIADWLFQKFRPDQPKPPQVFHYTSPVGLLGILERKEVWATHVAFLNDSSEFRYTLDLTVNAIAQMKERDKSGGYTAIIDIWNDVLSKISGVDLFVASFSEKRDLLSQWRAYCPPLGGFSLGFEPMPLMNATTFPLVQCIYDSHTQMALLDEALSKLGGDFYDLLKRGAAGTAAEANARVEFLGGILFLGAVFKHPAFHEECEWRLVAREDVAGAGDTCFRVGRSGLVPYKKLSLGSAALSLVEVFVGPNQHPELAMGAAHSASKLLLGRPLTTGLSAIPYRSW